MRRRNQSIPYQATHEVAMAPLSSEIHRRRSALLPAAQVAQIHRSPKPAASLADQKDRLILALEGDRHRFIKLIEQTDAADRRCRQNGAPVGLVVERDIAGDDGEVERTTVVADAAYAVDELPHDLQALGIAEIKIVGDRERPRSDCAEI